MKDFITSSGKTIAILQQHFPTENTINNCAVNIVKSQGNAIKQYFQIGG